MRIKIIFAGILMSSVLLFGAKCSPGVATQPTPTGGSSAKTSATNVNNGIVRQQGVISTFPTAVLPLLDKTEAFDSIRNTSDPSVTVHEVEYASNTAVDVLYGKFKAELTGGGWTEQDPQTQTVGTIQIMTGTFVKNGDSISVAVQTAKGTTKVKLKIEQRQ